MRVNVRVRIVATLAVIAVAAWSATALTLVKDGKAECAILVPRNANCSINAAALELQYHIEKMSGAKLAIMTEGVMSNAPATLIVVGGGQMAATLGVNVSRLPAEGTVIKTFPHALVLAGFDKAKAGSMNEFLAGNADQCGTYYAVTSFLRDQLGVRWMWPGETGEFIPKKATIEVPELNITKEPFLKRRHMRLFYPADKVGQYYKDVKKYFDMTVTRQLARDEKLYYSRMGMGSSIKAPAGHSFTTWWNTYSKDIPNVFAKLAKTGKPGYPGKNPKNVKMCVANPELWDLQMKNLKGHALSCCEDDGNDGFCTCPLCRAWDITADQLTDEQKANMDPQQLAELEPGSGPDGLPKCLSNRYARWYNEMARRVRAVDPQGYVTAYAYTRFRKKPIGITMEPNILIGYVGLGYPRNDEQNRIDRDHYLGWASPGVKMYLRPNTPHYVENGMPFMVAHEMGEDLQWCMQHGTFMMDVDSMIGHWASWGPSYYVWSRQMWEGPSADPQKLIDEWYDGFGPAKEQVKAYYAYWEEHLKSVWYRPTETARFQLLGEMQGGGNRAGRLLIIAEHYPPEVMAKGKELLDAALAAGKDAEPQVQEKLKNIEMSFHNAELTARATRLALDAVLNKDEAPQKMEELKALLPELLEYRRQIAGRDAVNVLWQTEEEIQLHNVLHWNMITPPAATQNEAAPAEEKAAPVQEAEPAEAPEN